MDCFRIFDEDKDGHIHVADLVEVLTSLGERLTKSEARKLVQKTDKSDGGMVDYQGKGKEETEKALNFDRRTFAALCDKFLPPEDVKEDENKSDNEEEAVEEEAIKGEPSKDKLCW